MDTLLVNGLLDKFAHTMSVESDLTRREFLTYALGTTLLVGGLGDISLTLNKKRLMGNEAKAQVEAQGITSPSYKVLKDAKQIRYEGKQIISKQHSLEELQKIQETEAQEAIFIQEVKKSVSEEIRRGEGPSDARLLPGFGTALTGDIVIVRQLIKKNRASEAVEVIKE
jgi:hypothetical protein